MNPAPAVTIRGYAPDRDDEGLLELFRASFPGWPTVTTRVPAIDHLRWKTRSHPRAAEASVVAEADGRLIGASMQWVYSALVRGKTQIATSGMDTAVHPDFRGQDVYTRLRSEHATFDPWVDFRIGSTVNEFIKRKRESFGYRFFGNPIEELAWPASAPENRPEQRRPFANLARRFRRTARLPDGPAFPAEIEAQFDDFARAALEPFDFAVARTLERFRWRHFDSRGGPAHVRWLEDAGRPGAVVVIRARGRRGYIADLLALPGRDDLIRAAVAGGLAELRRHGFTSAGLWLPSVHPYRAAVLAEGFVPSGRTIDLRYQPVAMPLEQLAFLDEPDAAIHFMIGDTDLI